MRLLSPDGAGGGIAEFIPQEFKDEASLKTIPDVPTLVKNYVNAQKLIGQDRVTLPQETWTPEDYSTFYTKLGRPQAPGEYTLPEDVKLDESLQIDNGKLENVRKTFFDLGLNKKQAEGVLRYYFGSLNEQVAQSRESERKSLEEGTAALKIAWGDKFNENLTLAKTALTKLGDENLVGFVETSGLGNNPHFVQLMHKVGTMIGEDSGAKGGSPTGGGVTREQALAQIDEMKADPDMVKLFGGQDAVIDPKKKQELLAKWQQLHKIAYPGTQE